MKRASEVVSGAVSEMGTAIAEALTTKATPQEILSH
jgi:hypothetical protein